MRSRSWLAALAATLLVVGAAACGDEGESSGGGEGLSGKIAVDGSSTVFPFAQAAAETFNQQNPNVQITVGQSGTGGGFEKFCAGEVDIADASREIKPDEEAPLCKKKGISYKELQVAADGIAVATNKQLAIPCMTVDQLSELWSDDKVKDYSELDPKLPKKPVSLFGPGTDSGTFDFFTEEVNGEEGKSRKKYQPSEDDNVLVQGVSGDANGLGYFGFSYYSQNQDKLNLVGVDAGSGCVKPSVEAIQNEDYKPLSRPLYMYVSDKALRRPEVKAFVKNVLDEHQTIAQTAQIVPMAARDAQKSKKTLSGQ